MYIENCLDGLTRFGFMQEDLYKCKGCQQNVGQCTHNRRQVRKILKTVMLILAENATLMLQKKLFIQSIMLFLVNLLQNQLL